VYWFGSVRTGPVRFGHWTGSVRGLVRFADWFGSRTGSVRGLVRFGAVRGPDRFGSVRIESSLGFFVFEREKARRRRRGGEGGEDVEDGSSISRRCRWKWVRLIDVELVREVVEDLVGRTGEATGRGEREVCSNEKVGKVLRGDLAGDGVVIAGRAGVLQNGLVVG